MLSLRSNPLSPRTFLSGMLGALAAALLVIVAMVLLSEYTKTRGRLLLTFLVLASFCLSATEMQTGVGDGPDVAHRGANVFVTEQPLYRG